MIKKTVTYKNWENEEVSKDFFFHLNEAEILELDAQRGGDGYFEAVKVASENDNPKIVVESFKLIVTGAVGRREGDLFIKDDAAKNALVATNAYSALLLWMLEHPLEAAEFINGMMPADAQAKIAESKAELVAKMQEKIAGMAVQEVPLPEEVPVPETRAEITQVLEEPVIEKTPAELAAMPREELDAYFNSIRNQNQ